MTEVESEEKEVLDDQMGFKCNSGQKTHFVNWAKAFFRALAVTEAFSIVLREMVREWNRMVAAGITPHYPPKFYPKNHPDIKEPSSEQPAPEPPEGPKRGRRPKKN